MVFKLEDDSFFFFFMYYFYRLSLCKGYLSGNSQSEDMVQSSIFNVWWMVPLENNRKVSIVPTHFLPFEIILMFP
jgi:hypothetical protein